MSSKAVLKYLGRNPQVRELEPAPEKKFKNAIVIPVLDELDFIEKTLNSIDANSENEIDRTAVVIVVNNSTATDPEKVNNNQELLNRFRTGYFKNNLNLFWIDGSSPGNELKAKGGVGLARKLGMDKALTLLDHDNDPIIFSLDADTIVSDNYLEETGKYFARHPKFGCSVIHFEHLYDTHQTEEAISEYELFMRIYSIGLSSFNSPYRHYTIGSAFAVRAVDYVKAGGMRVRTAGEDFYFMQQVSKVTQIGYVADTTVYPSARISDRVEFGTGPRMQQALDGDQVLSYNPAVFWKLKELIDLVESVDVDDFSILPKILKTSVDELTYGFLEKNNVESTWAKVYQNMPKTKSKMIEAFHVWFDGLRTLQFVHHLEGSKPGKYGRIPFANSFRQMSITLDLNIPEHLYESNAELLDWLRKKRM